MNERLRWGIQVIGALCLVGGSAAAGPHYSVEERLQCSDAVIEVEIPIAKIKSSDERRWQRNRTLPRIWRVGKKAARAKGVAGQDVPLRLVSSWMKDFTPVPDIVLWHAREQGKLRVLLFLRNDGGDTWRYVFRSANGFPNDQQIDWAETLTAVRKWVPAEKKASAECSEE
jgi:hypothetical protein